MTIKKKESKLSKRLVDIVNALPLRDEISVLEIGCGPGAMAREISKPIANGRVLAIDRSAKAIQQAITSSQAEIETGKLCKPPRNTSYLCLLIDLGFL